MTADKADLHEAMSAIMERSDLVRPMAIRTAATLRLADYVAKGVDTVEALAQASGSAIRPLRALIGTLVSAGLFEISGERISLSPLGIWMTSEASQLADALDTEGPIGRYNLSVMGMVDTVRTGRAAFETLFGQTYWEYVASSPDRARKLGELQSPELMLEAEFISQALTWSDISSVLDVGGGNGALIAALLSEHPHLEGAVFDLPGFAENANLVFRNANVPKARYIGGDFFKGLPEGFDAYILSAVLYDWDDERSIALLNKLAVIPGKPRLIVSEITLGMPGEPCDHRLDLQMYCGAAGFSRTPREVIALAEHAGLALCGDVHSGKQRFVAEFQSALH